MKNILFCTLAFTISFLLASCDDPAAPETTDPTTTPFNRGNGNGAIYIVNSGDNSISVLHPEKHDVMGTIKVKNVEFPNEISLIDIDNEPGDEMELLLTVPGGRFKFGIFTSWTSPRRYNGLR